MYKLNLFKVIYYKKRLLPLLLVLVLTFCCIVTYGIPVFASTPVVRYHVTFDESVKKERFINPGVEHKPLIEML